MNFHVLHNQGSLSSEFRDGQNDLLEFKSESIANVFSDITETGMCNGWCQCSNVSPPLFLNDVWPEPMSARRSYNVFRRWVGGAVHAPAVRGTSRGVRGPPMSSQYRWHTNPDPMLCVLLLFLFMIVEKKPLLYLYKIGRLLQFITVYFIAWYDTDILAAYSTAIFGRLYRYVIEEDHHVCSPCYVCCVGHICF